MTADQPLPEYTKAYELADGTSVAVVKDQPLPAPVLAEVQAQVQAAMSTALAAGSDESIWAQTHDASKQLSGRVGSATGKRVLIVYPAVGMLEGENVENNHRVWIPRDVPGGGSNTQQGAVDAANAYVASQADPDEWVVIVASE
ncbi:hypothetical protein [Cellulomonas chitinilytica]|uniref:hypothetical protein n=1 Tax=Cellulomonas chitinilytica TaxID=398759 RepID=UPI0019412D81|nr:hypothetical protein [Cellulomonas chitinilytica]